MVMAPKTATKRCRSFRITIFEDDNVSLDELDRLLRATPLKNERCFAFQKEKCPDTGRLHLQGFLQTERETSYDAVRKSFPGGNIWVKKADNPLAALEYANKDDTRVEGYEPFKRGDIKEQGKRTDIAAACEAIQQVGYVQAFLDNPSQFVKYVRGFQEYSRLLIEQHAPAIRPVMTQVFWGDAGSGKSHLAATASGGDCYRLPLPRGKGGLWFDGYNNESTLIIEDFNGWLQYKELLRICDGYKERWQVKGGFILAYWSTVIITSNSPPNTWYHDYKDRDDGTRIAQDIWDQRNDPNSADYNPSPLQRRINLIVSTKGRWPNSVWTQTLPLVDGKEVVWGEELPEPEISSEEAAEMLSFMPFGNPQVDEHNIPFPN